MSAGSDSPVRRHVIFHGRVQGVCFRMIARELSQNFRVVGYVRNRPDGTVELEAEGTQAEVERYLASIGREFANNIRQKDLTELPPLGEETDFQITY